jgi:hypothetical protein
MKMAQAQKILSDEEQREREREGVIQERLRAAFPGQAKAEARRKQAEGMPEAPKAPAGIGLEALTYPRGLLGHATQYVYETARLPSRWLSLTAALAALAKGTDRRVLGPTGNGTVLWQLLVAETGAGKQHALNCIRMLLRAMGLEDCIAAGGLSSVQAVQEILEGMTADDAGNPNVLIPIDEVGGWLKMLSSGGQAGNVTEIPGELQKLWGLSGQMEWMGFKRRGKSMRSVMGPAFSLYGESTVEKLVRTLTLEQIQNGFVNRFLLFDIGRGAPRQVTPRYDWTQMPGGLQAALEIRSQAAGNGLGPKMVGSELRMVPDWRRVRWGNDDLEATWLDWDAQIRGLPSDERALWIRAPEQVLRLATVEAWFCGTEVVDEVGYRWAMEVVKQSMGMLVGALDKNMREDLEHGDLVELVRAEFQKEKNKVVVVGGRRVGQMTWGQIHRLCEKKTKDVRKIGQVIAHLEACGDIMKLGASAGPGRPTDKWQWCRRNK